jgi:hypothetical protein
MAVEQMQYVLGADVSELLTAMGQSKKSLQDFKDQLQRFKQQLDTATEPSTILRLNKAIDATQAKIKTISTAGQGAAAGLAKVAPAANTAGQSLTNLGRIAQDAPFGFIGIQNNINPLLESFQRLQAESKATGTSLLSNLKGALVGGAGIGLAISVTTGLLSLMSQGLFDSKEEADRFADSMRQMSLEIEQAKSRIENFTTAAEELNRLNDINLNIFVDDEGKRKIIDLSGDSIQASQKLQELLKEEKKAYDRAGVASSNFFNNISKGARDMIRAYGDAFEDVPDDAIDELKKSDQSLLKAAKATAVELIRVQKEVTKARADETAKQRSVVSAQTDLDRKAAKEAAEAAEAERKRLANVKTIGSTIAEMRRELEFLASKEIAFGSNESKAKVQVYFNTIEKLIKDFKVAPKDQLINKLFGEAADIKIKNFLQTFREKVEQAPPIEIPVEFAPAPTGTRGGLDQDSPGPNTGFINPAKIQEQEALAYLAGLGITTAMQDGLVVGVSALRLPELLALRLSVESEAEKMKSLTQGAFLGITEGLGEALGSSLATGGSFITAAMEQVLDVMGEFLVQLGKAAIIESKLFLAIKAAKTNPFTGIAAGILAIAAGSALKAIKLPQFATGTRDAPGTFIAGERGREIISIQCGRTTVTPAAQSANILDAPQRLNINGRLVASGRDLLLVIDEATATRGRIAG